MKVLGFWDKLFTACVSVVEFKTLSDELEVLSKEKNKLQSCINDLNKTVDLQKTTIADLKYEVENPTLSHVDTTELDNEKEKHKLTLKLLEDAQSEIDSLNQSLKEERTVVVPTEEVIYTDMEETTCGNEPKNEVSVETVTTPVIEESVSKPIKEEVVVPAKEIVANSDNIQKFVNSLTKEEKKELKNAISKGHQNDKRLSATIKAWEKKYPLLETHVYYMFKTALSRRRGKNVLRSWYERFDNSIEVK